MIIGQYFVKFESYVCIYIYIHENNKDFKCKPLFFWVISSSLVMCNNMKPKLDNSSDNDFIRVGLGGMGYSHTLNKKTI